jgi:hypothetical protein
MEDKKSVKERDEAFINFVETGSFKKVNQYCKKYNIDMPKSLKVKAAGIYKAVFYCTNIPQDIKDKAFIKCLEIGFTPFINPIEGKEGA